MRAWRARVIALMAAVTLLMPASAFAEIVYRCRMTGSIGPKCCCSRAGDRPQDAPCQPEVDRPDCCEAQANAAPAVVASTVERMPDFGPAILSATLTIRELELAGNDRAELGLPLARGPPPLGPPVYIENCSLLR